jgi:hypothetical protein
MKRKCRNGDLRRATFFILYLANSKPFARTDILIEVTN